MEALINVLSDSGPVWTLVGILVGLLWILIKLLLSEKDKRIADAIKNRDDLVQPLKNIGDSLDLIKEKIRISRRG